MKSLARTQSLVQYLVVCMRSGDAPDYTTLGASGLTMTRPALGRRTLERSKQAAALLYTCRSVSRSWSDLITDQCTTTDRGVG